MQKESDEIDVNNEVFATEIKLQPNPSKDLVKTIFSLPDGKNEAVIKVIDVNGKLLYRQWLFINSSRCKQSIQWGYMVCICFCRYNRAGAVA